MAQDEDDREYRVLVNEEEQYSLWFASHEIPKGWRDTGKAGKKADCLAYVKEVWTDMRPLSLRRHMEQHAAARANEAAAASEAK
jgi:MbtH protein